MFFLGNVIPVTAGGVTAIALRRLEWASWEIALGEEWQRDAGFLEAVTVDQRPAA